MIGLIVGVLGTYLFDLYTGVLIMIVLTIIFLIVDNKKVGNVLLGGIVGVLIGWLITLAFGALFKLF